MLVFGDDLKSAVYQKELRFGIFIWKENLNGGIDGMKINDFVRRKKSNAGYFSHEKRKFLLIRKLFCMNKFW